MVGIESEHGLTCECGQTFKNPEKLEKHVCLQDLGVLSSYEHRKPDQTELEELAEWYAQRFKMDYPEAVGTVNQGYYIVIEGYVTGGPGFAGKVLIEIGANGPSYYNTYIWENGSIQRRQRASELQEQSEGDR